MREMLEHAPGRIYLLVLLLSVILMAVAVFMGVTDAPADGEPILVFGWMTMPLVIGVVFVIVWLIAYLIYFTKHWPYR
ncbi:MAG: hypothetical protein EA384_10140 [Spirochaetaceae bacterium]|nr:MAG: hypothetical protein EA384_10140 [Spirochaetaceae bacterium]